MASGVYCICNLVNGKRYIGSAIRLDARFKQHRDALMRGDHRSVLLQRAWNKYGEGAFAFRRLILCAREHLLMYEQRCIDSFAPAYNICPVAGSRLGAHYSDDARARLSELRRAAPRSLRQLEHLAHLADMHRGKPGRTPSEETRQKLRRANLGKKQSAELVDKRIAPLRGRARSPEARAAISAGKKGKSRAPFSAEWRANIGAAVRRRYGGA